MMQFEWLALAGLVVGVLVGLTGVGGGSLMTPLLITVFGIPAPIAVGTDLANAVVTKSVGTLAHRAGRTVLFRIVLLLATGSVPAAIATLAVIAMIDLPPDGLNHLIRVSVGVALLLRIGALMLRGTLRRWSAGSPRMQRHRRHLVPLTVAAGAVIGVAVALTSLGAGAIGAAALALLYPELEPAEIAGSDIAHAVPLTAITAAGHALLGTVDMHLLLAMVAGGVPGIVVGSMLTRRVPATALRTMFEVKGRRICDLKATVAPRWEAIDPIVAASVEPAARFRATVRPIQWKGLMRADSTDGSGQRCSWSAWATTSTGGLRVSAPRPPKTGCVCSPGSPRIRSTR